MPWEKRLIAGIASLLLIFAVLYVYFVMASIVHAAARQELIGKVATLQTDVSGLETEYLSKTQGVTEAYAHELGFVTANRETFIERQSVATVQSPR
jgi:hypothetical protein